MHIDTLDILFCTLTQYVYEYADLVKMLYIVLVQQALHYLGQIVCCSGWQAFSYFPCVHYQRISSLTVLRRGVRV